MDAKRLLATFLELVRIDSPSLKEADVAAYCARVFRELGCVVSVDDSASVTGSNTGNLIAYLPAFPPPPDREPDDASQAALLFSAHMDTVEPCEGIEPRVIDGVISSSGATILGGDDKVGIAAIIETLRCLVAEAASEGRPHPGIGVLLSVSEETGLLGARAMDVGAFAGSPCLVLDAAGEPGMVIVAAPCHHLFKATFIGKASHAGIEPEKGVSAIELASKAIGAMRLGRLDAQTTANVGTIDGGSAFNVVPERCTVVGEFRSMDEARAHEVQEQLASAIDEAVRDSGGSVSVEWTEEYRGFRVGEDDPLVQLVLDQARSLGLLARIAESGGGSDANIFAEKGVRALVLGTGMTDVHGTGESLAVRDLEALTQLCVACARALS